MMALVLDDGEKTGLLATASPGLLLGGGLVAVIMGAIFIMIGNKQEEDSSPRTFMLWIGWILGIGGVLAVLTAFFGPSVLHNL
jgi:hypothetical protein